MDFTFHPLIQAWGTWMRAQSWSERTITDRSYLIEHVSRVTETPVEQIGYEQVVRFLADGSFSSTTRQTYYASLRTWFRWQVETGRMAEHPMDVMHRPRAGRRSVRTLRTEHIDHLLHQPLRKRTRTMILLMAYQGLRCFEVAKIQGRDLDLISHEIVVLGKGDVQCVLPLHPIVEDEAQKYPRDWWFPRRACDGGGPILAASVGRVVGDAMRRAGIPGTAHTLRHWYATELLRAGVDTRVTQELMRHASMATTQRYLHVDDDQRRAAIQLLPDLRLAA